MPQPSPLKGVAAFFIFSGDGWLHGIALFVALNPFDFLLTPRATLRAVKRR